MKILLRETDGKVWALDPNTGDLLTTIIDPNTRCDDDLAMTTAYVRHAGIFWNNWENARKQLFYHEIIILETPTINFVEDADDLPAETPIVNRAKFDPANMLAEDMTIRQVYKCSAMEALITAKYPGCGIEDHGRKMLAIEVGELADAMIAEDRQHEESK